MSPTRIGSIDAILDPRVVHLAREIRDAGGRALLVGGWVRDRVRSGEDGSRLPGMPLEGRAQGIEPPTSGEIDLEVYGLPAETLRGLLERAGRVNLVGESFKVYKVALLGE